MTATSFEIQNVKCTGCVGRISEKLSKIDGVSDVSFDEALDNIVFNVASDDQINQVKETLAKMGYPLSGMENTLTDKAKSYVSCMIGRINS